MVVGWRVDSRGRVVDVMRVRRRGSFAAMPLKEEQKPQKRVPHDFARGIAALEFGAARRAGR